MNLFMEPNRATVLFKEENPLNLSEISHIKYKDVYCLWLILRIKPWITWLDIRGYVGN